MTIYKFIIISVLCLGLSACSDDETPDPTQSEATGAAEAQLANGIGPISNLELTALDPEQAERGEEIFETKCATCHKFDQRYVGPSLGGILERRAPAFVMNMMLNPAEMVEKHPEVKKLLAEFLTPMPDQNLSEEDARAVLEYIRVASKEGEDEDHHEDDDDAQENSPSEN